MLCEKCMTKTATVHVECMVNGVMAEQNLCFGCAAAINSGLTIDGIIKELLGSVIELTKAAPPSPGEEPPTGPVCRQCGMSYEAFRSEGRLGCAQCYDAFRRQLDTILKNIHGSSEHAGKTPRPDSRGDAEQNDIAALRERLEQAINREDYEAAAALRDKIRAIESQKKEAGGDERGR